MPISSLPCAFGGRSSHPHSKRPAHQATCNKYGKKCHFAVVCRATKKLSVVELCAVSSSSEARAKFLDVKVDGMPVHFKVDGDAEVTVVPSKFSGFTPFLEAPEGNSQDRRDNRWTCCDRLSPLCNRRTSRQCNGFTCFGHRSCHFWGFLPSKRWVWSSSWIRWSRRKATRWHQTSCFVVWASCKKHTLYT